MRVLNVVAAAMGVAALSACGTVRAPVPELRPAPHAWSTEDSASAHAAAVGFLAAFDSLHWEPFRAYFADDMTMFFPFPDVAARVDGRAGVEDVFRSFFSGNDGRVQGLMPRDLRIQMAGPHVAVATFHLGGSAAPSRRSIVLQRHVSAGWRVIHWHASPAPSRPTAAVSSAPLSAAEIAVYEGTYTLEIGTRTLDIRVFGENGQMKLQPAGQQVAVLARQSEHEFVVASDNSIKLAFTVVDNRATRVALHQGGGVFQGTRKQ